MRPTWWLDASLAAPDAETTNGSSGDDFSATAACSTQAFLLGSQVYVQPIVYPMISDAQQMQQEVHQQAQKKAKQQQPHPKQQQRRPQMIPLCLPRGYLWYVPLHALCSSTDTSRDSRRIAAAAERYHVSLCCRYDADTGALYCNHRGQETGTAAAGGLHCGDCCFPLTLRRIPVFIRGGSILAIRETPSKSVLLSMKQPLTVRV